MTIPSSVTRIESESFCGCSSLTSIIIPDLVTEIGNSAFEGCESLINIVIPASVKRIGIGAFKNCTALTELNIEDSSTPLLLEYNSEAVEVKKGIAFAGCPIITLHIGRTLECDEEWAQSISPFGRKESLVTLTIGDSVASIGRYFFYKCSSLTSVTIPKSVENIGKNAFENCSALKDMYIEDGKKILMLEDYSCFNGSPFNSLYVGRNIDCKDEPDYIPPSPFYGKDELVTLTLGDSVTSIGSYAFSHCSALVNVTIPKSVTSIGSCAFDGCSGLTSVSLPNHITSMKEYTFDGCSSLTGFAIPDAVTSIGEATFRECSALTNITFPCSVDTIGGSAFAYCSGLASIFIPQSVAIVGSEAFSNCAALKHLVIEDRTEVLRFGRRAFLACPLDSVYIGGEIEFGGNDNSPFYWQSSLRTVVIGDKVKTIPDKEFYLCSRLRNIVIGNGVTSVGEDAFYSCDWLRRIVCYAVEPPYCAYRALEGVDKRTCSLTVPEGSKTAYQEAFQWCEFFNIQGTDVTGIETVLPDNELENAPVYNLQGVQMKEQKEHLPTGIYIQGGKKIFIR